MSELRGAPHEDERCTECIGMLKVKSVWYSVCVWNFTMVVSTLNPTTGELSKCASRVIYLTQCAADREPEIYGLIHAEYIKKQFQRCRPARTTSKGEV